jgi:uncharacterized membrane protein
MKKYFLTGLVTLLPIAVTFWVVHFIVDFLTKPFIGLISIATKHIPGNGFTTKIISQIAVLICLVLFTWFLGFVARKYIFNRTLKMGDRFLIHIPLVNKIYKTSKDIVKSLFSPKTSSFKQVVLLPFPYRGSYCVGLIARNAPNACSRAEHETLISVFVPTTPNPTTGFLVMCHKSELVYLDMKSEEAVKYIVSCGVIQPGKL